MLIIANKNTSMRKFIISLGVGAILCLTSTFAQTIRFEYDASGNRTSRRVQASSSDSPDGRPKYSINSVDTIPDQKHPESKTDSLATQKIMVYPNPTDGEVYVSLPNTVDYSTAKYNVFDLNGKMLLSGDLQNETMGIDLARYASGLYFLELVWEGKRNVVKIIKQ